MQLPHDQRDALGGVRRRFVFPDPDDGPAGPFETPIGVAVAPPVRRQFVDPEPSVGLRRRAMGWTSMPITSIDEDGQLRTREDDVGAASQPWQGCQVDPIPEAEPE
jgi:hypothetical protein